MPDLIRTRTWGLFGLIFFSLTACQSPGSTGYEPGQDKVHLAGRIIIQNLPPQRTSLYFEEQSPGNSSLEAGTKVDGAFSIFLPPGTYRLKALPRTACPIQNTLILPPSHKTVRITVTTSSISFSHCAPSTLIVQDNSAGRIPVQHSPSIQIRGVWNPAPTRQISLFVSPILDSSKIQEIPVQPDGTFSWNPSLPGKYQLQAAGPGLCPLMGTVMIKPETQYLEILDPRLSPGAPCPAPRIAAHSGAFSLSGDGS
ncbi:MAG: ferredoxin reductase domain-containing protein [Leptospirales bacterium]